MKLEAQHISRVFGPTEALKDVSFSINDSEFVSIVGRSGCGKTTMLRIVAGLESASGGQILVGGHQINGPDPAIAVGFQNDRLLPWRNVRRNVEFGLELRKKGDSRNSGRVDELLDLVGLREFERRYPYQLSGGMRQRANLARALAVDPEVLLLDEPFSALDAQTREIMQAELLRIWGAAKKTVMFVTHQIDEAVFLSDRVIVMSPRPGRIQEIIDIDLARPRALRIKHGREFNEYVSHISRLLGVESDEEGESD